jgi:hypothetical protein
MVTNSDVFNQILSISEVESTRCRFPGVAGMWLNEIVFIEMSNSVHNKAFTFYLKLECM